MNKDFIERLAVQLRVIKPDMLVADHFTRRGQWNMLLMLIADMLDDLADNFNRNEFYMLCGYEKEA